MNATDEALYTYILTKRNYTNVTSNEEKHVMYLCINDDVVSIESIKP